MTTSDMIVERGSDQARKALLHLPEPLDSEPQEKSGHPDAHRQSRHVELALPAQDAPPEPVYDAHHGIKRVQQTPLFGHHIRTKPDRRDIKPELNDKRNDISKIPIFNVEGGD